MHEQRYLPYSYVLRHTEGLRRVLFIGLHALWHVSLALVAVSALVHIAAFLGWVDLTLISTLHLTLGEVTFFAMFAMFTHLLRLGHYKVIRVSENFMMVAVMVFILSAFGGFMFLMLNGSVENVFIPNWVNFNNPNIGWWMLLGIFGGIFLIRGLYCIFDYAAAPAVIHAYREHAQKLADENKKLVQKEPEIQLTLQTLYETKKPDTARSAEFVLRRLLKTAQERKDVVAEMETSHLCHNNQLVQDMCREAKQCPLEEVEKLKRKWQAIQGVN